MFTNSIHVNFQNLYFLPPRYGSPLGLVAFLQRLLSFFSLCFHFCFYFKVQMGNFKIYPGISGIRSILSLRIWCFGRLGVIDTQERRLHLSGMTCLFGLAFQTHLICVSVAWVLITMLIISACEMEIRLNIRLLKPILYRRETWRKLRAR